MALYKVQSPYNAALQGMQGAAQTSSSMTKKQEVKEGKKSFGGAIGSMVAGGGLGLGTADMFSGGEASKAMWSGLKGVLGGTEAGSAATATTTGTLGIAEAGMTTGMASAAAPAAASMASPVATAVGTTALPAGASAVASGMGVIEGGAAALASGGELAAGLTAGAEVAGGLSSVGANSESSRFGYVSSICHGHNFGKCSKFCRSQAVDSADQRRPHRLRHSSKQD